MASKLPADLASTVMVGLEVLSKAPSASSAATKDMTGPLDNLGRALLYIVSSTPVTGPGPRVVLPEGATDRLHAAEEIILQAFADVTVLCSAMCCCGKVADSISILASAVHGPDASLYVRVEARERHQRSLANIMSCHMHGALPHSLALSAGFLAPWLPAATPALKYL